MQAEHYPSFRLAGSALEFKLETTEQTFLKPKSLADLSGQVKIMALEKPNLTLTTKCYPGKKSIGGTVKLKNKIAQRSCETELKAFNGKPIGGEFEVRVDGRNKLQLETLGTKADSVKWTLEHGLQQLKIKTIIPQKQLVLGLDSIVGAHLHEAACICVMPYDSCVMSVQPACRCFCQRSPWFRVCHATSCMHICIVVCCHTATKAAGVLRFELHTNSLQCRKCRNPKVGC